MKILKRLALGALSGVSGVLIACAYGVSYSWGGQVRDAVTSDPIPGIRVGCERDGQEVDSTTTGPDGEYRFNGETHCDELQFTDVDGAENGSYDATQITPGENETNDVELMPTDA
jgi:hypothetical protein